MRSFALAVVGCLLLYGTAQAQLQTGAAIVDITPTQLPVIVNGGMLSATANTIKTRLNARAIVVSDGNERIAIVVADSCMMPRELLDEAKQLAATRTKLKPDRILISATHTHSAASCMGALGTDADPSYIPLLRQKLVEAIEAAEANLEPAEVGWSTIQAPEYTALRRWVRRPDRVAVDPFGNPTVRANMHAAANPDDAVGPTGPEDPELSLIGFRSSKDKRPIALLSNFSMHYFSDAAISADYFGLFCDGMQAVMQQRDANAKKVVAIMSHGCSGDIWRRDYFFPAPEVPITIEAYSQGLIDLATKALDAMQYQSDAKLAMAEARVPMKYRVPDAQRLEWAQRIVAAMGDQPPKTTTEVYAREQIILHERQSTEIVLQALRIGNIAIATTPCETYALTGMKLKLQSPTEQTMVIELANGGDGYIPPAEQHPLGGYNTWAARSAGLEVTAEPRIVAKDLELLERVMQKPRRRFNQSHGPEAKQITDSHPLIYYRLHELSGPVAIDASGNQRHAAIEPGVLFFLEGDDKLPFTEGEPNRCTHFAGGRLRTNLQECSGEYTLSMSFWNGMPDESRDVAGWMFSHDEEFSTTAAGVHLGLGGKGELGGKLVLQLGNSAPVVGKQVISRWTWHRIQLTRTKNEVLVYLDGNKESEVRAEFPPHEHSHPSTLFFGGRSDQQDGWEGRLDEIALWANVHKE